MESRKILLITFFCCRKIESGINKFDELYLFFTRYELRRGLKCYKIIVITIIFYNVAGLYSNIHHTTFISTDNFNVIQACSSQLLWQAC